MPSVKQGGIKYHFFSLFYDSTLDWTATMRTIGEHSNHYANGPELSNNIYEILLITYKKKHQSVRIYIYIYIYID